MSRRGVSLAESVASLAAAGVVLAASGQALFAARRLLEATSRRLAARQQARAGAQVLAAELRDIAPAQGDLLLLQPTSLRMRAMRATGASCEAGGGRVLVRRSTWAQVRAVDPARDSAALRLASGEWERFAVTSTGGGACPGGGAADRLGSSGLSDSVAARVGTGAPIWVFEVVEYRLYRDASGDWWLGVRGAGAGGWSATSPVAGPLTSDGLAIAGFDAGDAPTADPSRVRRLRVVVRAVRAVGVAPESTVTDVALRNE